MVEVNWLQQLTGKQKPIIGMVHLPALSGTPLYDDTSGMDGIREWVKRDLDALQSGGVDAVMFCNENDRPYRLDADFASVAAMSDVVASFRDQLSAPFGVNVLWDPNATLAVAAATGASFCREIFTGAFAGDFGLWVRSAGDAWRYRRQIGAEQDTEHDDDCQRDRISPEQLPVTRFRVARPRGARGLPHHAPTVPSGPLRNIAGGIGGEPSTATAWA